MVAEPSFECPHCLTPMVRWGNPQLTNWSGEYQYVCFNDACPYYVRGWVWMCEHYNVAASYRHRLDPGTHEAGPLPVWSATALRNLIIPGKDEVDAA